MKCKPREFFIQRKMSICCGDLDIPAHTIGEVPYIKATNWEGYDRHYIYYGGRWMDVDIRDFDITDAEPETVTVVVGGGNIQHVAIPTHLLGLVTVTVIDYDNTGTCDETGTPCSIDIIKD